MAGNRFNQVKRTQILVLIFISGFSSFTVGTSDFHLVHNLLMTYEEAKSHCREMYTDLATVHDFADMNNLITLVSNTAVRAWIGLEIGNKWVWHWSSPDYALDFLNWNAGEPQNNAQSDCAAMDERGKWFGSDCLDKKSFVCHGGETGGPVFVANDKTWRDAQDHCRDLSSDLVGIHSAEENEAVHHVAESQNVWIGLFKDPWKWSDGSNSSFRNWKPSQPANNNNQECVVAVFRDAGEWNDLKCSTKRNFVCRGASTLIPTTTKPTSTQETFMTNQLPTDMTTSPYTASQGVTATFTFTTSTKQPNTTNVPTEGGMTATGPTTPDTTDVVSSTFSTEVNNATGVQVTTSSVSAPTAQDTTQLSTMTSTETSFLPPGNLILIKQNLTWIEAMSYCREHHYDLVHVSTIEIQEEVAKMAKNATSAQVWLGLRYTCQFNFWFWTRSTSGCYQNWAPGQGSVRTYHCGVTGAIEATGGQQWVGLPGTVKLNFICIACVG